MNKRVWKIVSLEHLGIVFIFRCPTTSWSNLITSAYIRVLAVSVCYVRATGFTTVNRYGHFVGSKWTSTFCCSKKCVITRWTAEIMAAHRLKAVIVLAHTEERILWKFASRNVLQTIWKDSDAHHVQTYKGYILGVFQNAPRSVFTSVILALVSDRKKKRIKNYALKSENELVWSESNLLRSYLTAVL